MSNLFKKIILAACLVFLLSACTVTDPQLSNTKGDAIAKAFRDDIRINNHNYTNNASSSNGSQLPSSVSNALLPDLPTQLPTADDNQDLQRFDVSVNNVPAKDFFMGLVKGTRFNMAVDPQVTGMISLELKNVSIPDVLDEVRDVYGFEYNITNNGYEILPRKLETRLFNVNFLDINRNGTSQTGFGSGEITRTSNQFTTALTSGTTSQQQTNQSGSVETKVKADFWKDIRDNLTTIIGTQDGRNVVVNPQSGAIVVRAYPNELRDVAQYLDSVQNTMTRQVIIEAQILEVQLSAQFQTGINWKLFDLHQGAFYNSEQFGLHNPGLPEISDGNVPNDFSSIFALDASAGGTFSSFIELLNTQGKVNVLSSPRISTTNNQTAVIKVGNDRFFVTNVTSNTTTGVTAANNQMSQNVELTPFFSGIALDVTPQIDEDDNVTLHIHPIISKVTQDNQKFIVNGQPNDLPLAQSAVRESDSIVHAKNGQIIVLGGLMENSSTDYTASTPGTEHLGTLSNLFKSTNKNASKFELVILLRPIVTRPSYDWNKNIRDTAKEFRSTTVPFSYNIVKSNPCNKKPCHR